MTHCRYHKLKLHIAGTYTEKYEESFLMRFAFKGKPAVTNRLTYFYSNLPYINTQPKKPSSEMKNHLKNLTGVEKEVKTPLPTKFLGGKKTGI